MIKYLNAIGLVASLTLATNLLGFFREILIARAFGASAQADAFIAAFTIISVCFLIFSAGTVQSAFMPSYQHLITVNKESAAIQLLRRSFLSLSTLLLVVVVVVGAEAQKIVTFLLPGFKGDQIQIVSSMVLIMAPMIFFNGTGSILQSVAHSQNRFLGPALIPLLNNIVIIGGLLVLVPRGGIKYLAGAYLVGSLLWWVILLPQTFKKFKGKTKKNDGQGFIIVLKRLAPLVVLLGADQISALIQKTIASQLTAGSIAALSYASKLQGLPVGIFSMAISTVFFPALIDAISRRDEIEMRRRLNLGFLSIMYVLIPATVFLFMEASPVVQALFERGAFNHDATYATAHALQFYVPGLFAQGLIVYLNRVFFAAGDMVTPMKIGTLSAFMHIFFCWFAVRQYGYIGIAIGTTIYAWLYVTQLFIALKLVLEKPFESRVIRFMLRPLVASVVMIAFYFFIEFDGTFTDIALAIISGTAIYITFLLALRDPFLLNIRDYF